VSVASDLVSKLPRQVRWAVPAAAVAAVGLVIAGSAIAGAQAAPELPARSTAQLLAAVDAPSALPSAVQAVVQETANLGLPDLPGPGSSDPLSGLSLLSGTHTFKIWYDGPTRVRIAIPVTLGETDLRRDGRDVWLWDSRTSRATHYVLPAASASTPDQSTPDQSTPDQSTPDQSTPDQSTPMQNAPTPQQVARQILAAVGQTTTVGLQSNVMVAGQAAYQLSLAPKDSRSLIGQVRIAIDAGNSLPLRVQIFARGASAPALEVGYTSLSFARPAASNFPFTPPPGAKVKTITVPAAAGFPPGVPFPGLPAGAVGAGSEIIKAPSSSVVLRVRDGKVLPGKLLPVVKALPASAPKNITCARPPRIPAAVLNQITAQLPKGMSQAQRAALLKKLETGLPGCSIHAVPAGGWLGITPSSVSVPPGVIAAAVPRVLGHDWLSVLVLPAAGLSASGSGGLPTGTVVYSGTASSSSSSSSSTLTVSSPGPGVDVSSLSGALLSAARPVHGSWGSGRLIRTSLISVLITDSGRVLIGAVQPSVLYADAAQLR
jgi:outer membrane lipoprotein-sorting protein